LTGSESDRKHDHITGITLLVAFHTCQPIEITAENLKKMFIVATLVKNSTFGCMESQFAVGLYGTKFRDPIVVGGIIGYPTCGKSTFYNCLLSCHDGSPTVSDTPYLHRTRLTRFNYRGKEYDIAFLDTREYYFNLGDSSIAQHDEDLLRAFICGLKSDTVLSKKTPVSNVECDPTNAPTHLVFALNSRDIWRYY
jgi:hypothetical protein